MIFIARAFCPLVLEIECVEQVCVQNVLFIIIKKKHIILAKLSPLFSPFPLIMVGLPMCFILARVNYWPQRRAYDVPWACTT